MKPSKIDNKYENLELVNLICERISKDKEKYKNEFRSSSSHVVTRFVSIDQLLPEQLAHDIYHAFSLEGQKWREFSTFREKKLTSKQFDEMPKILGEITFAIQHPRVISLIEEITEISKMLADPTLYAGGLSKMRDGDFLNPHIDNSHNQDKSLYRRVNLLYYCTPGWKLENGGNLELWDKKVIKNMIIPSLFNSLVLMETNNSSWHSVSPIKLSDNDRCCVSNYYFTKESPSKNDYYHVTSFQGRPEEPMKRMVCLIDNTLRRLVRAIAKGGLGKKDLYISKKM